MLDTIKLTSFLNSSFMPLLYLTLIELPYMHRSAIAPCSSYSCTLLCHYALHLFSSLLRLGIIVASNINSKNHLSACNWLLARAHSKPNSCNWFQCMLPIPSKMRYAAIEQRRQILNRNKCTYKYLFLPSGLPSSSKGLILAIFYGMGEGGRVKCSEPSEHLPLNTFMSCLGTIRIN